MSAPNIDLNALNAYLTPRVPSFTPAQRVEQLTGGASNPTFLVKTAQHKYVLRAKPLGAAPTAHAVDREYGILAKLARANVPIPAVHVLCEDESVIGSIFYLMDYVPGRVFFDRLMRDSNPQERRAVYLSLATTLACLHSVEPAACALDTLARADGFAARQVKRWRTQYEAASEASTADMLQLAAWLEANLPPSSAPRIVHGDYRLGNVIIHETEPRVMALLDWELTTLGDPIADLAYCCMSYHLPSESGRGFLPLHGGALAEYGIPSEAEFVGAYCAQSGVSEAASWPFWMAFSMFRGAAILTGVQRRADGNAPAKAGAASLDMIAAGRRHAGL